jgi:plastocyanin
VRHSRRSGRVLIGLLVLALGPALATTARAHGPAIDASYSAFRPRQVTIAAGDTIHFRNAAGSDLSLTIVADDGSFESPVLGRAEGWHHTFEAPGDFPIHLKENSATRARILVGPPRPAEEFPEKDGHEGHDH